MGLAASAAPASVKLSATKAINEASVRHFNDIIREIHEEDNDSNGSTSAEESILRDECKEAVKFHRDLPLMTAVPADTSTGGTNTHEIPGVGALREVAIEGIYQLIKISSRV